LPREPASNDRIVANRSALWRVKVSAQGYGLCAELADEEAEDRCTSTPPFAPAPAASCSRTQTPPARLAELTEREREILQLVAAGLSNAEIARSLVISPLTAKTHVARILAKLDCHDRAQLVTLAYETGFVTPGAREAKTIDSPLAETLAPQQRQSSDERGHEAKAEGGASQRAASGGEPSAAGAPRSTSKSRTVVLESHCESQGRWEREHGAGDAGVEQERP
jgi:DNA-binding CsgD family transcriptional regulator